MMVVASSFLLLAADELLNALKEGELAVYHLYPSYLCIALPIDCQLEQHKLNPFIVGDFIRYSLFVTYRVLLTIRST